MWIAAPTLAAIVVSLLSASHEKEDCDAIYRLIIGSNHSETWKHTHAVLNATDLPGSLEASFGSELSRLPLLRRPIARWQFHAFFVANRESLPLSYSRTVGPDVALISTEELRVFLNAGITVLRLSRPGFSLSHRNAVVFLSAERPNAPPLAPFFEGSLLYFKKVNGRWISDERPNLPRMWLVT